jgi:NADH dehydrogenase
MESPPNFSTPINPIKQAQVNSGATLQVTISQKKVVIVGGGFAGLNAAKLLGRVPGLAVTVIDSRNYHLFQPLLYQVALAGLNPADIAAPIRSILSPFGNIRVHLGKVTSVDAPLGQVTVAGGAKVNFDYLILAAGSNHAYFGHDEWEQFAPGLKTLEQATQIRRRILIAFEEAEICNDPVLQKRLLTFVVVGGGPTGVELAGAIAEMSHFTIAKDFRSIDPRMSRVILIEAAPRILGAFAAELSASAAKGLEKLGVEIRTLSLVSQVDDSGVVASGERIQAATVLWAAGVKISSLGESLHTPLDAQGRVLVEDDLSVKGFANVFVVGDMAKVIGANGKPLPGLAPVALQQGRAAARNIRRDIEGRARKSFSYVDKGMLATVGRNKAVGQFRNLRFTGFLAWVGWLCVHIYFLAGFTNRFLVVFHWAWSYLTFRRGARLILGKDWRQDPSGHED